MSLHWDYAASNSTSAASCYSTFKTVLAQTGFRGDVLYRDNAGSAEFRIRAVDYVRNYVHTVQFTGTSGSQMPASFNTDFPGAIAMDGTNLFDFSVTIS